MKHYINKMNGYFQRAQGYGRDSEVELLVNIYFDAVQFNRIKKTQDPLTHGMAQIKNVVCDTCGIRGIPSHSPISYNRKYNRAKDGLVKVELRFDVDKFILNRFKITNEFMLCKAIDLQTALEATRDDGHMFAKTAFKDLIKKV